MSTTTFAVKKMDCQSCAIAIEGICEDTAGVTKAEVNARTKTLTVEHAESVDLVALATSLDAEGFPVEPQQ